MYTSECNFVFSQSDTAEMFIVYILYFWSICGIPKPIFKFYDPNVIPLKIHNYSQAHPSNCTWA